MVVKQDNRSNHKCGQTTDTERPKGRHEKFQDDQPRSQRNQGETGEVDRQQLKGVERQYQRECAYDTRQNRTGVVALEQQAVDADQKQAVGNCRVGQHHQKTGAPVRRNPSHGNALGVQYDFMLRDLNLAAIELLQQIRYILGNNFYDVLRKRVLCRQTRRSAHGTLGPIGVAAPQLRQSTDIGDGIIDGLALAGCCSAPAELPGGVVDEGAGGSSGAALGGAAPGGSPPIEMGVAAPRLVAGAIAARWLA